MAYDGRVMTRIMMFYVNVAAVIYVLRKRSKFLRREENSTLEFHITHTHRKNFYQRRMRMKTWKLYEENSHFCWFRSAKFLLNLRGGVPNNFYKMINKVRRLNGRWGWEIGGKSLEKLWKSFGRSNLLLRSEQFGGKGGEFNIKIISNS